jgi:hypothetical protein
VNDDAWAVADPTTCPECGRDACEDHLPPPLEQTPPDDVIARELRITAELDKLRVQREARRRLEADDRGPIPEPEFRTLRERLAVARPPVGWRIEGWQPTKTRALLAAQFKAGKTTAIGNVLRCLADGDDWLGQYPVTRIEGTVALIDTEMSESQLDAWLAAQHIRHDDAVIVESLRGQVASFNLSDPERRARWGGWLRKRSVEYLILDCLRPVLDALGLDEHREAGRFLTSLDTLLRDAGIGEALVVQHMGHLNERSRGDSRLRDWPDIEWRLVRQDDDPRGPRFITAYGRDVDVSESRLDYDSGTRRLTVAGGSRKDAKIDAALEAVYELVQTGPPLSGRAIKTALADSSHARDTIDAAIRRGLETYVLTAEAGRQNARLYAAGPGSVRSVRSVRPVSAGHTSECPAPYREAGHSDTRKNVTSVRNGHADEEEL